MNKHSEDELDNEMIEMCQENNRCEPAYLCSKRCGFIRGLKQVVLSHKKKELIDEVDKVKGIVEGVMDEETDEIQDLKCVWLDDLKEIINRILK